MNELKYEQTEDGSQVAEATEKTGEGGKAVSYGKFKDAEALLSAYNSLQAEFTKRCQRVKELETEIADKAAEKTAVPTDERNVSGITPEDKENVLRDYLKTVLGAKSNAIVMDGQGTGLKTPVNRPKTIREAGDLARQMLAKK